MRIFTSLRSYVLRVLRDHFKFLCILVALCSSHPLSGKKSVCPLPRSKIHQFHLIPQGASQILFHSKLSQEVPQHSSTSFKSLLIPSNFLYSVILQNPDFFFKLIPLSSMAVNNLSKSMPIGSPQRHNSTTPLSQNRSSNNSVVAMANHRDFLKLQSTTLQTSSDRRISLSTPSSPPDFSLTSPMLVTSDPPLRSFQRLNTQNSSGRS